jgi:ketosteroid isomerase-like protein
MTATTSFFHGFFEALDAEDGEAAMQYVADDMEFAILWASDTGRQSKQFTGGPEQLRAFTAAGDRGGWAHYILHVSREGNTEIALGETRWDDGRHIGTFVAAAELDADGRMRRYLVGRSPALRLSA